MNPRIYGLIDTDNFGGDYPDETWIVHPWVKKETAEAIAKLLNDESCEQNNDNGSRYYLVKERGYKLQPGFEP